ncbi:MAG TPA: hypothetical protein PLR76_00735 [Hyphomonas sp.]|nr:hypothetical protein [Hyphomonas sp.]MCA8905326.1 hypothetical protein [Hyphomonas sp.]MCB9962224.1 hypothetical protein [Hyphomonas sp.]MCB9969878.1 hypothetical protein [Hyphomonas sp.]HPE46882.1 hypothetical protein [Hyphomonas sp.]
MDTTKLRLLAAVAGLLMGGGGVIALFVAMTLALAEVMGLIAAAFVVAGTLLVLAAACLLYFLKPYRSVETEAEQVEEATAEALADLPFDTIRTMIRRRPLTVTALALLMGYTLVRNPQAARRHAERFIMSML